VGPIRVPRYLDRPEWVTRPGGSTPQVVVDGSRRWAGGFSSNVLSVLGESLGAKLGTQRVIVYPAQSAFALDYRVAVDFHAFEGIGGEAVVLRANWLIRAGSGEAGPWSGHFAIRRPIAGGGSDALVGAHNEALDLLAEAIASRIESLEKARVSAGAEDHQAPD
ncbi:MAG: membrane integrity-associated transporter subunit PqiC, partial [Deltaproteobacteria bacterium]|nr:membrane integrity-associated transporter subunit PqiC [Deltaproteobacteria bacterium]